jgi:hypothetical protein
VLSKREKPTIENTAKIMKILKKGETEERFKNLAQKPWEAAIVN